MFHMFFFIFGHAAVLWKITKICAPKLHAEPTDQCSEISHMRPIQARKLKLKTNHFFTPSKKDNCSESTDKQRAFAEKVLQEPRAQQKL